MLKLIELKLYSLSKYNTIRDFKVKKQTKIEILTIV